MTTIFHFLTGPGETYACFCERDSDHPPTWPCATCGQPIRMRNRVPPFRYMHSGPLAFWDHYATRES